MDSDNRNNVGWECPKCGRIYSPIVVMCLTCPKYKAIFNTSSLYNTSGSSADKNEIDKPEKNELPFDERDQLYLRRMLFD